MTANIFLFQYDLKSKILNKSKIAILFKGFSSNTKSDFNLFESFVHNLNAILYLNWRLGGGRGMAQMIITNLMVEVIKKTLNT